MIGRRSAFGVSALVALALCALAASSAFAAPGRAFTCAPGGTQFSDAHCNTAGSGFGHTTIANGTETAITATSEKTGAETKSGTISILKGKISGIVTEVQCQEVHGTGVMTNNATFVSGSGTLTYSKCTVTKPPSRNCTVGTIGPPEEEMGMITTNKLVATTEGQATNNKLKFAPASGTEFANIAIDGCLENSPPKGMYPVSGSLVATTSGATTSTTHTPITEQGTLTFGGNPAGIEGKLTISMLEGNPLVLT